MSSRHLIKKIAQSKFNSALLQELVLTLDEPTEELLSGGELVGWAKPKFERTKPHTN